METDPKTFMDAYQELAVDGYVPTLQEVLDRMAERPTGRYHRLDIPPGGVPLVGEFEEAVYHPRRMLYRDCPGTPCERKAQWPTPRPGESDSTSMFTRVSWFVVAVLVAGAAALFFLAGCTGPTQVATCPAFGIVDAPLAWSVASRDTVVYLQDGRRVPVSACVVYRTPPPDPDGPSKPALSRQVTQ